MASPLAADGAGDQDRADDRPFSGALCEFSADTSCATGEPRDGSAHGWRVHRSLVDGLVRRRLASAHRETAGNLRQQARSGIKAGLDADDHSRGEAIARPSIALATVPSPKPAAGRAPAK
jgi:hypothetical protein